MMTFPKEVIDAVRPFVKTARWLVTKDEDGRSRGLNPTESVSVELHPQFTRHEGVGLTRNDFLRLEEVFGEYI